MAETVIGSTNQVTVPAIDNKEDPKHVEEMIKKAEGTADNKSVLLAGKYKNEEELQKGILELIKKQANGNLEAFYKELETKTLGGSQQQQQKQQEEVKKQSNPVVNNSDQVVDILTKSGIDINELNNDFIKNQGKLSEAMYEKLAKAGFPKFLVDGYIEGQKAIATQTQFELYKITQGEENYKAMLQWAEANLSDEDVEAFNSSFQNAASSGNIAQMKFVIEALYNRFVQNGGRNSTSSLLHGETTVSFVNSGERYESLAQMKADMSDPKYKNDPAFREKVIRKLANSNIM